MPLNPRAPLPALAKALARLAWNVDTQAMHATRAVFEALCRQAAPGSGVTVTTVHQLAMATGYSDRHTRRALYAAEDAGLIHWRRGYVDHGGRVPSTIRVLKGALFALIERLRPVRDTQDQARNATERERLAGLTIRPRKRRLRRSSHVDMASYLPPSGCTTAPPGGRPLVPDLCSEHLMPSGTLPSGLPVCPGCRLGWPSQTA